MSVPSSTTSVQDQIDKLQAMAKGMCTPIPTECASVTEEALSGFSKSIQCLSEAILTSDLSEALKTQYSARLEFVRQRLRKIEVCMGNNTPSTLQCTALFLATFRMTPGYCEMQKRMAGRFDENPLVQAVTKQDFQSVQQLILSNPTLLNACYSEHCDIANRQVRMIDIFCNRMNVEAVDVLVKLGEETTQTGNKTTLEWVLNGIRRRENLEKAKAILKLVFAAGYDMTKLRDYRPFYSTPLHEVLLEFPGVFEDLLPVIVNEGRTNLDLPCHIGPQYGCRTALQIAQSSKQLHENQRKVLRALIFNGASVPRSLASDAAISYFHSIRQEVEKERGPADPFIDSRKVLGELESCEFMHFIPNPLLREVVDYAIYTVFQRCQLCYELEQKRPDPIEAQRAARMKARALYIALTN